MKQLFFLVFATISTAIVAQPGGPPGGGGCTWAYEYAPTNIGAIDQSNTFPVPRYLPGHSLLPNVNWLQIDRMVGTNPSSSTLTEAENAVLMNLNLGYNFNYYYHLKRPIGYLLDHTPPPFNYVISPNAYVYGNAQFNGRIFYEEAINGANNHPDLPVSVRSEWGQANANNPIAISSPSSYGTFDPDLTVLANLSPLTATHPTNLFGLNGLFNQNNPSDPERTPHVSHGTGGVATNFPPNSEIYMQVDASPGVNNGPLIANQRRLSPASPYFEDMARYDGRLVGLNLLPYFTNLTRPIDLITDNNEAVAPNLANLWWGNVLNDADCVVDASSLGYTLGVSPNTWGNKQYVGQFRQRLTDNYHEGISEIAELYGFDEVKYTGYSVWHNYTSSGQVLFNWEFAKLGWDQIEGNYYSTPYCYHKSPSNWMVHANGASENKGLHQLLYSRKMEIADGDKFNSPFVWSGIEPATGGANQQYYEDNQMNPAMYLGMLKTLSAAGSEFFYSFHYSSNDNSSDYWVWKFAIPSYAQGIISRYESEFFLGGSVLDGNAYYSSGNDPNSQATTSFNFEASSGVPTNTLGTVTLIRKNDDLEKFMISTFRADNDNCYNDDALEIDENIYLEGSGFTGEELKIKTRAQGSVYIYDRSGPNAIFYQLDGWHEDSHPFWWSRNFAIEAELFDNSTTGIFERKSEGIVYTPGLTDLTNVTTYLQFQENQSNIVNPTNIQAAYDDAAHYNFQPRPYDDGSVSGYDLSVRAYKHNQGGKDVPNMNTIMVFLDGTYLGDIVVNVQNTWTWFNFSSLINAPALDYKGYELSLVPRDKNIYIDKINLERNTSSQKSIDHETNLENVSMELFPNPAMEEITIRSSHAGVIRIKDLTGREIQMIASEEPISETIAISDWKAGVYIVDWTNGNAQLVKKIVKQ